MIHEAHQHERIVTDPRITVEMILRKLGAGMTTEEVLQDHPHLTPDDIRAAQAFADDDLADQEVVLAER